MFFIVGQLANASQKLNEITGSKKHQSNAMTEPFGNVRATAPLTPLFKAAAATYCDGFLFRAVAGKTETALFGLKYAKRCQSQSAGAFTPKIDRSPMLGVFLIFQPRSTLCKALKKILPTTDSLSHGTAHPSPAGVLPFRYPCWERHRAGRDGTPSGPPTARNVRATAPVRCSPPSTLPDAL